jgi:hypothetical protein
MKASKPRMQWSVLALATVGALAAWAAIQVRAVEPDSGDRPSRFGMVGIARAQTARLNVVNVRAQAPDSGDLPSGPCRVELQFLDSQGMVLKMSEVSLAPGQAGFLDLARGDAPSQPGRLGALTPDGPDRQQIRAVWQTPDNPDMPECGRSNFIGTVEVFGRDGKTTVLYSVPDGPDAPAR